MLLEDATFLYFRVEESEVLGHINHPGGHLLTVPQEHTGSAHTRYTISCAVSHTH